MHMASGLQLCNKARDVQIAVVVQVHHIIQVRPPVQDLIADVIHSPVCCQPGRPEGQPEATSCWPLKDVGHIASV